MVYNHVTLSILAWYLSDSSVIRVSLLWMAQLTTCFLFISLHSLLDGVTGSTTCVSSCLSGCCVLSLVLSVWVVCTVTGPVCLGGGYCHWDE